MWGDTAEIKSLLERGALRGFDSSALDRVEDTLSNLGRNEHRVYHPEGSDIAYKVTRPGVYGARRTFSEYLKRLIYLNEKFGTGYSVLGAAADPHGTGKYSLVISQPWVPHARSASQAEIDAFFHSMGLGKYTDQSYWDPYGELLVSDANPTNVLAVDATEPNGSPIAIIYPVDVIPDWVSERRMEAILYVVEAQAAQYRKEQGVGS